MEFADNFKKFIEYMNIEVVDIDSKIAEQGAKIRGQYKNFKAMDALITNFHLPESTLVMLVSAFAGREHVLSAYEEAVRQRYRFFSFGDAMFIA